jgi:hypothetical protein
VYSGPADGGNRLWLRRLDQLDATPIAGTEGGSSPFFSPDGERVGFIKDGTSVRIASLAGAPTVTLTDKANTTSGDWGDDGYIYFEVDSGVARMRAAGGSIEPVYTISAQRKEIATEWVRPACATGVLFRLRHRPGSADFEMRRALPRGDRRRVRGSAVRTHGASGRHRRRKLIGTLDPEEAGATGAPSR